MINAHTNSIFITENLVRLCLNGLIFEHS